MRKKLLSSTIVAFAAILASATACTTRSGERPINAEARHEAETAASEAAEKYGHARGLLEYAFSSFHASDAPTAVKKWGRFFDSEAEDFKAAEDGFKLASARYAEALDGGAASDSELHRRMFELSEAYRKWAELAELDRQICLEASAVKDEESFAERAKEIDEQARRLCDEVNREILSS